jgi:hypothetical protein
MALRRSCHSNVRDIVVCTSPTQRIVLVYCLNSPSDIRTPDCLERPFNTHRRRVELPATLADWQQRNARNERFHNASTRVEGEDSPLVLEVMVGEVSGSSGALTARIFLLNRLSWVV